MANESLVEISSHLDRIPIKISTQCNRKKNIMHIHNHVQLCYVLSGTLKHTLNNKTYIQNPGSCIIILPYTRHMIDLTESDDTPVVTFISFFDNFMTDRGYRFFPYGENTARFEERMIPMFSEFSGERREIADELVRNMMAEFSKQKNMSYDRIASRLAELFHIICIDTPKDCDLRLIEERITGINKAVKYIEEHYAEKITIDTLCSVAAMSRSMFTQHFKAITGMTLAQFLVSFRMRKALNLVLWTELSLNEIASKTGLYNKTNLVRTFSKHFGESPIRYREQNLPNILPLHNAFKRRWEWLDKE